MRDVERGSAWAAVVAAVLGTAAGWVLELALSRRGHSPFVPPLSLAASFAVIAAVLVALGVRLRRTVLQRPGDINPFHAVRLLAAARAGLLVGALGLGFGTGLLLSLLGRSVAAPSGTWLPMVVTSAGGAVLVVAAVITERLCRVPPPDDEDAAGDRPTDPLADGAPDADPAFRKR